MTQECLRNVAKHARATAIGVRLAQEPGSWQLAVSDNGHGFDVSQTMLTPTKGHYGVRILSDIAAEAGATLAGVRAATEGHVPIDPRVAGVLFPNAPQQGASSVDESGLSQRELQVLAEVARGHANKQIAKRLGITEGTAKGASRQYLLADRRPGPHERGHVGARPQRGLSALRRGAGRSARSPSPGTADPAAGVPDR